MLMMVAVKLWLNSYEKMKTFRERKMKIMGEEEEEIKFSFILRISAKPHSKREMRVKKHSRIFASADTCIE